MTSSDGNIFRVTGPLWRKSTGHRWIRLTRASEAQLWCFLWSTWMDGWANNRDTGDFSRHRAHYGFTIMQVRWCLVQCIFHCYVHCGPYQVPSFKWELTYWSSSVEEIVMLFSCLYMLWCYILQLVQLFVGGSVIAIWILDTLYCHIPWKYSWPFL